jgi:hypothetical protein
MMDNEPSFVLLGFVFVAVGSYFAARCWAKAVLTLSLLSILAGMAVLILLISIIPEWKAQNDRSLENGFGHINEITWMNYHFNPHIVVNAGFVLATFGTCACIGYGLSRISKARRKSNSS